MKARKFLGLFLFLLVSLFAFGFNASVKAVETSADIKVDGAQIRTVGNAGIRFVANEAYEGENETAYGIVLAFGQAEANEEFVIGGTVNGKAVANAEVASTNEGQFAVTLYNIPETFYTQVVSARAYVVDGEKTIYSDVVCVRSLAEVALKAKNAFQEAEIIDNVIASLEGAKKAFSDSKNNFYVDAALYETNYAKLAVEFTKDWNAFFDLELDPATAYVIVSYDCPFKKTATGSIPTASGLYKFFSDEVYGAKWSWFLDYLLEVGTNGPADAQIEAIKNADDTLDKDTWYSGISVVSYIVSTFNAAKLSAGAGNIDYTSQPSLLGKLATFNNKVYADLSGCEVLKAGEKVSFPEFDTAQGYKGTYKAGATSYEFAAEYNVTEANQMFIATVSPIAYTVEFVYEDEFISELQTTYTVESAKELPIFNLDGYAFEAWYDNEDLEGEPVTSIEKGSTGNKVFYAKMVAVSANSALINYVNCDYSFEQLRDEFIADWMTYSDSGKRVFDMTNTAERTTTYAQFLAVSAVLKNETFRTKYDNVITAVANAIVAQNPWYKSQVNKYLTNGVSAITANEVYYHFVGEFTGFWNQTKFLGKATYVEVPMTEWTAESTFAVVKDALSAKYTSTQVLSTIGDALATPERAGYTFAGWYTNAEYTGEAVTVVSAEATTLYAKWVKAE